MHSNTRSFAYRAGGGRDYQSLTLDQNNDKDWHRHSCGQAILQMSVKLAHIV